MDRVALESVTEYRTDHRERDQLSLVRKVSRIEDLLSGKESCRSYQPLGDAIRILPIVVEIQIQNIFPLATDGFAGASLVIGIACKQCDGSEEIGRVEILQDGAIVQASACPRTMPPLLPVLPQFEVICCKGCSEQLENRERHSTGVHLLEHRADGVFRRVLEEFDYRELVFLEREPDGALECIHDPHLVGVIFEVRVVAVSPFQSQLHVEEDVHGEVAVLILVFGFAEIQIDLPGEIALDHSVVRNPDDGVDHIIAKQRLLDIQVVVSLQGLLLIVLGPDRLLIDHGEIEGR